MTPRRREHMVAVRQRPHLAAFLERVAQLFEVVIFTASQKARWASHVQCHLYYKSGSVRLLF